MTAANISKAIHQLIHVLPVSLWSVVFRAGVGAQLVDFNVREICEGSGYREDWSDQPRIGGAELIDQTAVDGPRIGDNSLAGIGSLRARKCYLRLRLIEIGNAKPVIQKTHAKLMLTQVRITVHAEIVLVGEGWRQRLEIADLNGGSIHTGQNRRHATRMLICR